jgi:flagellar motor switch protein FliM
MNAKLNRRKPVSRPLEVGRPDPSTPQFRLMRGAHEAFAQMLEPRLSSLLQVEMKATLGPTTVVTRGDYNKSLHAPSCLIALRLSPRAERMILHLHPATVFTILELLLGGRPGEGEPAARELTEIEWSLLEGAIRIVARALGEAWKVFHAIEFDVELLTCDPQALPCPDASEPLTRILFAIQFGEKKGEFEIAVPQGFFETENEAAEAPTELVKVAPSADMERNLGLIEDAKVGIEVTLNGPALVFRELLELKPGQVVTFDYPLTKPLQASLNGAPSLTGHIIGMQKKRALQVEALGVR